MTQPLAAPVHKVSLSVQPATTVTMTGEQQSLLRTNLTSALASSGISLAAKGDPDASSLDGTVTRYDRGIRWLRWVIGFLGAGAGHLDSTWRVRTPAGADAGECRIEGSIYMGGFGGSFDDVIEKVGYELRSGLLGED